MYLLFAEDVVCVISKLTLTAESNIIEVSRGLNRLNLPSDIVVLDCVAQVRDGRMCGIVCAKDLYGFFDTVRLINIIDYTSTRLVEILRRILSAYR